MDKNRKHKINNNIRVRFAPSPTGYLHVGGLRTYLYNCLFAKKHNGKLILRIEDTDRERLVEVAVEDFIDILKKIDLPWDEGPFFQSDNIEKYKNKTQELVDQDKAYYCFCSQNRLKKVRQEQKENGMPPKYDGHCRNLDKKEIKEKLEKGESYVIRLKVPQNNEKIIFNDVIRGKIKYNLSEIDDQVLLKSDGWPTYHLANVIDDHDMKISHVIRGEEWLPSTPKHILLYKYFGWTPPQFVHVPLLLNKDQSKLSKRQGDVAVGDYLKKGYLKKALINFLVLLGWHPGTGQEIFTLDELIKSFSLKRIQKSGAVFDNEKLDWINGKYIREMDNKKLVEKCLPFLKDAEIVKEIADNEFEAKNKKRFSKEWLEKIIAVQKERMKTLKDIVELSQIFLTKVDYDSDILIWKKSDKKQTINNLNVIYNSLNKLNENDFNQESIQQSLEKLSNEYGTGEIFWPARVALAGQKNSPQPKEIAEILGKDLSLERIKKAIKILQN